MRKLTEGEAFKVVVAARDGYAMDGMLEVDVNAKLSIGKDARERVDGCYVQAWVWVRFEDAGVEVEPEEQP